MERGALGPSDRSGRKQSLPQKRGCDGNPPIGVVLSLVPPYWSGSVPRSPIMYSVAQWRAVFRTVFSASGGFQMVWDHGLSDNGSFNICHLFLFCSFIPSYKVSKNRKTNRGPRTAFDKSWPSLISAPFIEACIDRSGPWLPLDTLQQLFLQRCG